MAVKVFWDTNLFIYLIEQHPTFHPRVLRLYDDLRGKGDEVVTSTLTLGELLAQPLRLGRVDLVSRYTELLSGQAGVQLVAFDQVAAGHYAKIRAGTSLKQPDALQLACAAASGARIFITNDERLWGASVPDLEAIRGL